MTTYHALIAVCFVAVVSSCTSPGQDPRGDAMAPFARMVGGEWKMTAPAGTGLFNTWHWGPGNHSLRMLTDGIGGDRNPWRALQVVYWHPGHKQVRSIQLSTYAAGVAESAIAFDGENAEAVTDMYQTGDRRKLKSRWKFDGPDKYHDELLETTSGREGYFLLAEWDWVRIATRPRDVEQAPKVSEHLKPFEPLLGGTWESKIEAKLAWAPGAPLQLQSSSEYVPLANGIYIRTLALTKDAEPMHLLDAYIYHHTGANALRCLALRTRAACMKATSLSSTKVTRCRLT